MSDFEKAVEIAVEMRVRDMASSIIADTFNKHLAAMLQEWGRMRFTDSLHMRVRLMKRKNMLSRKERNTLIKHIRLAQIESATAYRQAREKMGIE